MTKTIRAAIAAASVGGVLMAANPASAAAASYSTDFSTDTITTNGPGWRMSGSYDAQIDAGELRISNAVTSGWFGDQLFAPKLAVAASDDAANNFFANFTLKPVALQPGRESRSARTTARVGVAAPSRSSTLPLASMSARRARTSTPMVTWTSRPLSWLRIWT